MPGSAVLSGWLPPEGAKILLVLFLSFLIGLEREERKAAAEHYLFGGVRTFPLIGLIGYAMAFLSGSQFLPVTLGFAVVAGFLMLSYRHKLAESADAGVTTEMCGLTTYLIGALVYHEQFWIAATLGVASALMLELKATLESLTQRITPVEILTFTKFLLLTAVILPVLPNQEFGPFRINPFKTWLVVVAVSGVSYGSYVIGRLTKGRGGIVVSAILGGAYSSTATTLVLAKRAAQQNRPHLFSGAMLMASGMMYLRLAVLVAIFNRRLAGTLGPVFAVLAAMAIGFGWLWAQRQDPGAQSLQREFQPKNPLELRSAIMFALLFLGMVVATNLVVSHLGKAGLYSLAAIMGCVDVDPFVMGITQSGETVPGQVAAGAIVIAAASNNLAKATYAYGFSDRKTGIWALCLLGGLAAVGLAPLLWLSK
jgi:uncharacterized membrane protein (DUF4010 family)